MLSNHRLMIRHCVILLAMLTATLSARTAERPNFLIIMADDCTYNDLPIYGGQNAKTPNIDALAKRGLTFDQAYVASAMCQPCRAELFTGQYPLTNGCAWNHSASRSSTKSLPHLLRPLGYRVGIAGKIHVQPKQAFPFDRVRGFDSNCVRDPTQPHSCVDIEQYMSQGAESPFCLTVALVEPHIPWVMGDPSRYPPAELRLPSNLADTPETRKHFSSYLAEITYMDGQVGEILRSLERSGQSRNTVVMFTSEQGSQFPGCKWTNWNTGLHTALICVWPNRITGNRRTRALVQYADIAPTLLDIAGAGPSPTFDGTSFAGVLRAETESHREFAYAMHNNLPEGPRYPIRSVTDGNFRYIRNLAPDELYIEHHLMGGGKLNNPYWATWMGVAPLGGRQTYKLIKRYMKRPAEQFYATAEDPYEMTDLAGSPTHDAAKQRLRTALDLWMKQQSDPGGPVDTVQALEAARQNRHLHGEPR